MGVNRKNAHELGIQSYEGLFAKMPRKKVTVTFSGRFREYGANITSTATTIDFRLSKEFLEVGEEINIGVMQYLLCKLFRSKKRTLEMDLYDAFLKKVGEYESAGGGVIEDEELQQSFDRVNEQYFHNYLLAPTIRWGRRTTTQLGLYSFANDTITISTILHDAGELLDFVVYHELLHKKHKFEQKGTRTHSHTPAFRRDERKFILSTGENPEKALEKYLRGKRPSRRKGFVRQLLEYF